MLLINSVELDANDVWKLLKLQHVKKNDRVNELGYKMCEWNKWMIISNEAN